MLSSGDHALRLLAMRGEGRVQSTGRWRLGTA